MPSLIATGHRRVADRPTGLNGGHRSRGPGSSNPPMRPSDRCEVMLRLVVVVVVLAAIPAAGTAGSAAYVAAGDRIRAENSGKASAVSTDPESVDYLVPDGTRRW